MISRLSFVVSLCMLTAGFAPAQTGPVSAPPLIGAGSDPGVTPSGFPIYDNQALPADIEVIKDVEFGHGGTKLLKLNAVRQKQQEGKPKAACLPRR